MIHRRRKIFSNQILYMFLVMLNNHCGYQEAVLDLNIRKLIDDNVSYQAINNKVLSGKFSEQFNCLNNQIIQKFFVGKKSRRVFGVDGSHTNLSRSNSKNGFRLNQNKKYSEGLLTLIFDVNNQIPFGYQLTQTTNERVAFSDLAMKINNSSVREKDLFIFDRGYFSSEMVKHVLSLNKDFLFRLPNNLNIVKQLEMSNSNDKLINSNGKSIRIIKYQTPLKFRIVKDDKGSKPFKLIKPQSNYYLATTLIDQTANPIEAIKHLYHQRWSTEECYKKIKSKFNSGTFHSVHLNGIECEIAVQQFSLIITRLFIGLMKNSNQYQINSKISSNIIVDHILPMLMFDNQKCSYLKNISDVIERLENIKILVRPGRSYPRIKRFRSDKFLYKKPP